VFLTPDEIVELDSHLLSPGREMRACMDRILPTYAAIRASRLVYALNEGTDSSGVYFLFNRWALLYVGKASCIFARLRTHYMNSLDRRTIVIPFNKVAVLECPAPLNSDVEVYYLEKLRPPFNVKMHR